MESSLYPQKVSNKNIPDNVFLIANLVYMDNEIQDTYYINREGDLLMVSDWNNDIPIEVSLHKLTEITGDSEMMIMSRWKDYFYFLDHPELL
jgi:hypothetical protein